MEINGIAHAMLTVSNFETCAPFYRNLLTFLGLKPVIDGDGMLYCVGGRTAVGIVMGEDEYAKEWVSPYPTRIEEVAQDNLQGRKDYESAEQKRQ